MSDDERISRLEARIEVLERLIRQVLAERTGPVTPPLVTPRQPELSQAMPAPAQPIERPPVRAATPPAAEPPPRRPAPAPSYWAPSSKSFINEEWLGTKGLLAVGVVFLVLGAGYILKLSFDRGWVSPMVRCISGAIAGGVIGVLGWRLHEKRYRTYGASLIGAGGAILYLAAWAAGRLYQFLPTTPAIASLALISLALAAVAWAINVQALASAAALGAFFAPIVIGKESGSVNLLLLYLGAMGACLGAVAAVKRWRITTFIVALAYFGLVATGILSRAYPAGLYLYAIFGGCAGLYLGLREGWFETRFLSFWGGWGVLMVANQQAESHWATVVGGVILAAPVWWRALKEHAVLPDRMADGQIGIGDTFYFYLTPLFVGAAVATVVHGDWESYQGFVPLLVAIPYLAAGIAAPRRPFALVGTLALVAAAFLEWSDLRAVWALFVVATLWAGLDHAAKRSDSRWYALITFTAGFFQLVYLEDRRPGDEAAFLGAWALTLWWSIATLAAFAAGLIRPAEDDDRASLRPALWGAAGLILFFGVTEELLRHFSGESLAGGLSVSAWWILFAAGCFVLGFLRSQKPLRYAGFGVAALALGKVVLVDLSTLDAFYRIGSVLILGIVSLGVAYTYHRRAGRSGPARGGTTA
jgi:hypothetical protein